MMLAMVSLILFWFLVGVHSKTFPYVSFMGQTLANHSYVNFSQVGRLSYSSDSVQCHTDLNSCCTLSQGSYRGDWYFPNGNRLPFDKLNDIHEARQDRAVHLRRNRAISPSGLYRCDIETVDSHLNKMNRDIVYVGLYANGGNVAQKQL